MTESPFTAHIRAYTTAWDEADIEYDLLHALELLEGHKGEIHLASPETRILAALLQIADATEIAAICADHEICPIHHCDYQICLDDEIHA